MRPKWTGLWQPDRAQGVSARAALAACVLAASGCYERVVATEGIGAEAYDVHEPNLKGDPGPVENFIFGPRESKED